MLVGAKDKPKVSPDWEPLRDLIDGVVIQEIKHVAGRSSVLTELFRPEWDPSGLPAAQVFQIRLVAGAISAWHCHKQGIDRLIVNEGMLTLALYDDRVGSSTRGMLNEIHMTHLRPALVIVPCEVWHGIRNNGTTDCLVTNIPSDAYSYDDPDHYRIPHDSPDIPYDWTSGTRTAEHL